MGDVVNIRLRSGPFRALKATSRRVTVLICTSPRCMRVLHRSTSGDRGMTAIAEASTSQRCDSSVVATVVASVVALPGYSQA